MQSPGNKYNCSLLKLLQFLLMFLKPLLSAYLLLVYRQTEQALLASSQSYF